MGMQIVSILPVLAQTSKVSPDAPIFTIGFWLLIGILAGALARFLLPWGSEDELVLDYVAGNWWRADRGIRFPVVYPLPINPGCPWSPPRLEPSCSWLSSKLSASSSRKAERPLPRDAGETAPDSELVGVD